MKKKVRTILVIVVLIFPLLGIGLQCTQTKSSVWIITTDNQDIDVNVAVSVLQDELRFYNSEIHMTTLERISSRLHGSDVLVIVGHGQTEGLVHSGEVLPWESVSDLISYIDAEKTIILACHSPSDIDNNVYGFPGQIDAESGALITAWHIVSAISPSSEYKIHTQRVLDAQISMLHPLENFVYFVHGYTGNNDEFNDMLEYLEPGLMSRYGPDNVGFFDYFSDYPGMTMWDVHNIEGGISSYAENFADKLKSEHEPGTQIDIVAHSLGGIIAREMIRLRKTDLQTVGIEIGRVITLGTPHEGTYAAVSPSAEFISLLNDIFGPTWDTPVFRELGPEHEFIVTLNEYTPNYFGDIEWYTVAGEDIIIGGLFYFMHQGSNDQLVAIWSADLYFAEENVVISDISHGSLHNERGLERSYSYVENWLAGPVDPDMDGLSNAEEIHVYNTNPYDSDTDWDGLGDEMEIAAGYDPLNPDTDGDMISDGFECVIGCDPADSDTDDDGMPDGWEADNALYPTVDDASLDPDGDGLTNLEEFQIGTYPQIIDSDADLMPDGWEVDYGLNPLFDDSGDDPDNDSLTNLEEFQNNTNPIAWSSDADVLSDEQEIDWDYNPNDSNDPIIASNLISSAWFKSPTGFVRVNDPDNVDYVKVYVKYKDSSGY